MNRRAVADACFLASLATLPWIGVGLARLVTGRDLGAGLQPSWLLLAVATLCVLPDLRPAAVPRGFRLAAGTGALAVALSAWGLVAHPAGVQAAEAWSRYLRQVVQLGVMAAFLCWPAWWVRGEARWRIVARMVVFAALGQAAYGLLQQLHWWRPTWLLPALERVFTSNPSILAGSEQLHLGDRFLDVPRLRGTACEPLYLGNFLLCALPLVPLTGWRPAARAGSAAVLAALLVLTWSRGAWLAGAAAGLLALGLARPWRGLDRRGGLLALALAAGGAGLVVLALGPDRVGLPVERLAQSLSRRDWSNLTRLHSMQAAWRAFLVSPPVGVGWGQFAFHFPLLVDPAGLQSQFTWPVVNNFPLRILAETGLAGFAAFVATAAGLVRAAWRRRWAPEVRWTLVACTGAWLQTLVFSQYNLPHLWVAPGLLLAAVWATPGDGPADATP